MATSFNLTANLNLAGPFNVKPVVNALQAQLSNIKATVSINISTSTTSSIGTLNTAIGKLNTNLLAATTNANALKVALQGLGANFSSANSTMNATAGALNKVNSSASNAAKSLGSASTDMSKFGREAALAVKRAGAFALATGAIFGLARALDSGISKAIEFEKGIVTLQQVTRQSKEGLKGLTDEIDHLSVKLGVNSHELLEVAKTFTQAGLSINDTKIALDAVAKSALAPSFDSIINTTEGLIAVMGQFKDEMGGVGIGAKDFEKVLGSINKVSADFAVEADDIVSAIRRMGGVFAAASRGIGTPVDQLNELIAVFTSVRATTRESADSISTGLRTIFTRIQRPETIDFLKQFGVELIGLDGKFVGPYEAIKRLSEALKTLDTRDIRFAQITEELGGIRQVGKLIPAIKEFATAQRVLGVAVAGQTSLDEDAAIAQQSLANKLTKTREEFLKLVRDLTNTSGFKLFANTALEAASAVIRIADSVKELIPALTALFAIRGLRSGHELLSGFVGSFRGNAGPTRKNSGGIVHGFATGGLVPGVGDGDTVPAKLTPGEFVIRKKAVESIGVNRLQRLNTGGGVVAHGRSLYGDKDPGGNIKIRGRSKKITPLNAEYGEIAEYLDSVEATTSGYNTNTSGAGNKYQKAGAFDTIIDTAIKARNSDTPQRIIDSLKELKKNNNAFGDIQKIRNLAGSSTRITADKARDKYVKSIKSEGKRPLKIGNLSVPQFGGLFLRPETGTDIKRVLSTNVNEIESLTKRQKIIDKFTPRDSDGNPLKDVSGNLFSAPDKIFANVELGFIEPNTGKLLNKSINRQFRNSIKNLVHEYGEGFKLPEESAIDRIIATSGLESVSGHMFEAFTSILSNNIKGSNIANFDLNGTANPASIEKLFGKTTVPIDRLDLKRTYTSKATSSLFEKALSIPALEDSLSLIDLSNDESSLKSNRRNSIVGSSLNKRTLKYAPKNYSSGSFQKVVDEVEAEKAKNNKKAEGGIIQRFAKGGKARVFDFDDTLAKTKASKFADFIDPKFIDEAKTTPYTRIAEKTSKKDDIYVLTARLMNPIIEKSMRKYLENNNINPKGIIGVAKLFEDETTQGKKGPRKLNISEKKVKVLQDLNSKYHKTIFYDDDVDNIKAANQAGIKSVLAKKYARGGVAASDTVPALLTPGEFVVNKAASQRIGYSKLNALNQADRVPVRGYAEGGIVQHFASGGDVAKGFYSSTKSGRDIYTGASIGVLSPKLAQDVNVALQDLAKNASLLKVPFSKVKSVAEKFQDVLSTGGTLKDAVTAAKDELNKVAKLNLKSQLEKLGLTAVEVHKKLKVYEASINRDIGKGFEGTGGSVSQKILSNIQQRTSPNFKERVSGFLGNSFNAISGRGFGFNKLSQDQQEAINTKRDRQLGNMRQLGYGAIGVGATVGAFLPEAKTATGAGAKSAVSGVAGGLGIGLEIGSILGPYGAAIGAAVGAVVGGLNAFESAFYDFKISDTLKKLENSINSASEKFSKIDFKDPTKALNKINEINEVDIKEAIKQNKSNLEVNRAKKNTSLANRFGGNYIDTAASFYGADDERTRLEAKKIAHQSTGDFFRNRGFAGGNTFGGISRTAGYYLGYGTTHEQLKKSTDEDTLSDLPLIQGQSAPIAAQIRQNALTKGTVLGKSTSESINFNTDELRTLGSASHEASAEIKKQVALISNLLPQEEQRLKTLDIIDAVTLEYGNKEKDRIKLIIDNDRAAKELAASTIKSTFALELFADNLSRADSMIEQYYKAQSATSDKIAALIDRANGGSGAAKTFSKNPFEDIRNSTKAELESGFARIERVSGKTEGLDRFKKDIFGGKDLLDKLPDEISKVINASNADTTGADRVGTATTFVNSLGLSDIVKENTINALKKIAAPEDGKVKSAEEISTGIKNVLETIAPAIKGQIEQASKQFEMVNTGISEFGNRNFSIQQAQSEKSVKISTVEEDRRKQLLALKELKTNSIDVSARFASQDRQVSNLTGGKTELKDIAENIKNAERNIQELEGKEPNPKDLVALNSNRIALDKNRKALEILSKNTDKLTAVQEKIKEISQKNLSADDLVEQFMTGSVEERQEMLKAIKTARAVDSLPEDQRFNAINSLGKEGAANYYKGARMVGAFNKPREEELRRNISVSAGPDGWERGLGADFKAPAEFRKEETELINKAAEAGKVFASLGDDALGKAMIINTQALMDLTKALQAVQSRGGIGKDLPIEEKASGGLIRGPGTGTSDSIPTKLSHGEYVVKAASVSKLGPQVLSHINEHGELPGFKGGGSSDFIPFKKPTSLRLAKKKNLNPRLYNPDGTEKDQEQRLKEYKQRENDRKLGLSSIEHNGKTLDYRSVYETKRLANLKKYEEKQKVISNLPAKREQERKNRAFAYQTRGKVLIGARKPIVTKEEPFVSHADIKTPLSSTKPEIGVREESSPLYSLALGYMRNDYSNNTDLKPKTESNSTYNSGEDDEEWQRILRESRGEENISKNEGDISKLPQNIKDIMLGKKYKGSTGKEAFSNMEKKGDSLNIKPTSTSEYTGYVSEFDKDKKIKSTLQTPPIRSISYGSFTPEFKQKYRDRRDVQAKINKEIHPEIKGLYEKKANELDPFEAEREAAGKAAIAEYNRNMETPKDYNYPKPVEVAKITTEESKAKFDKEYLKTLEWRKEWEEEYKRDYLPKMSGGSISGSGSANSDSILARVSNGEFLINSHAATRIGQGTLNHINNTGSLPRFAQGGMVGRQRFETGGTATASSSNDISKILTGFNDAAKALTAAIQNFKEIPHKMEGKIVHTGSITLNGAQVLADIMPKISAMIQQHLGPAINQVTSADQRNESNIT